MPILGMREQSVGRFSLAGDVAAGGSLHLLGHQVLVVRHGSTVKGSGSLARQKRELPETKRRGHESQAPEINKAKNRYKREHIIPHTQLTQHQGRKTKNADPGILHKLFVSRCARHCCHQHVSHQPPPSTSSVSQASDARPEYVGGWSCSWGCTSSEIDLPEIFLSDNANNLGEEIPPLRLPQKHACHVLHVHLPLEAGKRPTLSQLACRFAGEAVCVRRRLLRSFGQGYRCLSMMRHNTTQKKQCSRQKVGKIQGLIYVAMETDLRVLPSSSLPRPALTSNSASNKK